MRKGEKITLYEDSSQHKKVFSIMGRDGKGASSVSYFASCGRKTGRLKEFYPCKETLGEDVFVIRRKDNQLVFCKENDSPSICEEMLLDYIGAYRTLEDAKKKAKKGNNSFATFIPHFEVFRGCNEKGEPGGSAYIWTADNDGDFETFDSYIDKVRKHPSRNPAKALYVVLKTLYNLTECIKTLHTAGLIHSDIKPENFGFPIRGGRCLTEQVQLFDINSVYSVYTKFPKLSGTMGYCAPEVFRGKITNQSDLYSIGAVLFSVVALCDDVPEGLYTDGYYSRIDEIVENSKLLNASPVTANVKFKSEISAILKKCLAKELRNRIKSCSELERCLRKACVLLLPAQFTDEQLDLGKKLRFVDEELDKFDESDSVFALQSLLFNHPLYKNADEVIRVTVLGFGVYGQQFLSRCLQSGQIIGKKLEVKILTKDKDVYKREYLSQRPALLDFFQIDGEGDLSDTNYGKLTFITPDEVLKGKKNSAKFEKYDPRANKELARELMFKEKCSTYVFVALGDDELNCSVARVCADIVSEDKLRCTVSCACSDDKRRKGIVSVNMTAKAKENKNYEEIERMAFNAHLSWSSPLKLNTNIKKLREDFCSNKYNHDSSVDCVLAIKNALYACGIELKDLSPQGVMEVSRKYDSFIKDNGDVFAQLVNLEHRRWVIEKITNGWTRREDLHACLYGPVNDKKNKQHPCIVKSSCHFDLDEYFKISEDGRWDADKWNFPGTHDSLLDELDTVSVQLHRVFYRAAQEIKNSYFPSGEETGRIMCIVKEHRSAVLALKEWILCLKRVWNGDEKQAKSYDGYRDSFLGKLKEFPLSERDEVRRYVKIIDSKVYPIIKAYEMRDYKSSDCALINAIPFVLTHREDCKLFVPLMTGDNTERFNNVSAVTLINPGLVAYGVYLKEPSDIRKVAQTVEHILSYMEKKEIKSAIKFAVVYNKSSKRIGQDINGFASTLRNMHPRIRQVMVLPVSHEAEIANTLSKNVEADAYENNSACLSALLAESEFYEGKPRYSFDSSRKKFTACEGCSWLRYIRSSQFITVPDMLSFVNSTGAMKSVPEYTEYNALWNLYARHGNAWKDMCGVLKEYARSCDLVTAFSLPSDAQNIKKLEFVISNELRESYGYIISYLRDVAQVISQDSRVAYKTTDSCKAVLYVGADSEDATRALFANPYSLMNPRDVLIKSGPQEVEIFRNGLVVSELNMADYPQFAEKSKEIWEILCILQKEGYIYNLYNKDDQQFSFVYSTRQAKELMTNPDRILEVYVYHKLQTAGFDDVVSGYEVHRCDTKESYEFDCIVTQGFRCAVIECKAQDKLPEDHYRRLSCLAEQFGINPVPILIADTYGQSGELSTTVETQRKQRDMWGVVTVCNHSDICNIDKTVMNILSGKY